MLLNNISEYQLRIENVFQKILPSVDLEPKILHKAMHYAVFNGGKRLRPLLVYFVGSCLGAEKNALDIPAIAVELIHCYSLVHDDLPAMDDDDWRRGNLSCHKAFDEATAILTGDALQNLAFVELSKENSYFRAEEQLKMMQCLTEASSSLGMAGGQALDLASEGKSIDLDALKTIHQKKTGVLIGAAVELGIISARCDDAMIKQNLSIFAENLGLAFQIQDDILDVEGDLKTLGKPKGSDQKHEKATYPKLIGMEKSKEFMRFYYQKSIEALSALGFRGDLLVGFCQWLEQR